LYKLGDIVKLISANILSKTPKLRPSFEGNFCAARSAAALVMNEILV